MRILHDVDARTDEKVRRLLHLHGMRGYGAFWVLIEALCKNGGELEMTDDHFYPLLADDLRCGIEEARSFIADCVRIGLFRDEGGKLISARLKSDIAAYQARVQGARRAASARWQAPQIAGAYAKLLERPKMTRSEFASALSDIGCSEEEVDRLWGLCREFSKEALGHYTRSAAAHLRANGAAKVDFISYLEKWLVDDRAQKRGFFATASQEKTRARSSN